MELLDFDLNAIVLISNVLYHIVIWRKLLEVFIWAFYDILTVLGLLIDALFTLIFPQSLNFFIEALMHALVHDGLPKQLLVF